MTETDSVNSLWRTRPVFITSTFQDLQAERDHLQQVVLPQLEEAWRTCRHYLEPIDLRTGIDPTGASEEARELQVLKVCLDEIERSRPYLIVILGDRYGWIPDATRLKAAAQEAGFNSDITGYSVTALEIEFGLFMKEPDQRRRCFFYFREPLPYAQMPPDLAARYCETAATDSDALHRLKALSALKAKIENDPELAPRIRHYQATWDSARQRVTGLDAWGQQVFNDLWSDLDEETKAFAAQYALTWEQQERQALEDFLELRRHNYTGREALLQELINFTQTPAASETQWGLCLTGEAGAGKSALLAELYRRLNAQGGSLLLTHAAGISPRANDVLAMLQRWIAELAQFLKKTNPLPSDANADTIEQTFASLLGQAVQTKRVIVLVDALNQFEATPRGRFVTWLPKLWPPNARLLVTTQTGEQSEALHQKPGIKIQVLEPLTAADARAITQRIWARYHRQAPDDVIDALINKTRTDGSPAYGNPLWLSFAAEELNLLDADDFQRAEQSYDGSILERIHQLILETANQLPAEVDALYVWLLDRCAKTFGRAFTHAYAAAIALSRFGWLDSDLKVLVPRLARTFEFMCDLSAWDELHLAALRRSFRAHIVRRGQPERWDFFHSQARRAIESKVLPNPELKKRMHSIIADHLLDLSDQDPLRNSEAMWHLIGADDQKRAAHFYALLSIPEGAPNEATNILATYILSTSETDANPSLTWTIGLLNQPELEPDMVGELANRFQFDLNDTLSNQAQVGTRKELLGASLAALKTLVTSDPGNAGWQRDLSVSHERLGDLYTDQGDLAGALNAYQAAWAITQRLADSDPGNADWQRDLSVSHERLGDLYTDQGDLAGALNAYQAALVIRQRLADSDPGNAGWQCDLSVSHERLGDLSTAQGDLAGALRAHEAAWAIRQRLADSNPGNAGWQRYLSVSQNKLGNLYTAQGDLAGALNAYQAALAITQRLADSDPGNAGWQRDLSVSHERLGNLYTTQGDLAGALRAHEAAFAIRQRLADSDPGNAGWQRDLSVSHERLGDLYTAQGDLAGALRAFQAALAITQRLADSNPGNAGWQRDLSVSQNKLGNLYTAQGDLAGALNAYQAALAITQRLADSDPGNAGWQRDLSVSHERLGNLYTTQGDLAGALHAYQAALAITQRLADSDPGNAGWQRDLSISHNNLGDLYTAQGDLAGALHAYQAALAIRQRLADSNPDNAGWQRDLSVSHNKLGNLYTAQGDLADALRAYQAALEIRQRLANSDPGNADWQRDLWVSNLKVANFLEQSSDAEAGQYWLRAYQTLSAMKDAGLFVSSEDEQWLAFLQQKVAGSKLE